MANHASTGGTISKASAAADLNGKDYLYGGTAARVKWPQVRRCFCDGLMGYVQAPTTECSVSEECQYTFCSQLSPRRHCPQSTPQYIFAGKHLHGGNGIASMFRVKNTVNISVTGG
jgi:hypothetical protein